MDAIWLLSSDDHRVRQNENDNRQNKTSRMALVSGDFHLSILRVSRFASELGQVANNDRHKSISIRLVVPTLSDATNSLIATTGLTGFIAVGTEKCMIGGMRTTFIAADRT